MDDSVPLSSSGCGAAVVAQQLVDLFQAKGFDLVKWISDSSQLLQMILALFWQSEVVESTEPTQPGVNSQGKAVAIRGYARYTEYAHLTFLLDK
ncbi:hypothetical protein EVAR_78033_1 [Eumeta japonica]|uniref:Uncharacterized protein n=1 Tax=Eumeta variegata TaxID=151549 RepID=A0A4C1T113_EUMVA|nr:hypothetical protein EVAR_78033_1 [Eumeta japonica]